MFTFLPKVDIQDYNVTINGQKVFDVPIKNGQNNNDNIRKIITGQAYDYTNGCLLNYPYFKEHCKIIAIDLCEQQANVDDQKN